MRSMYTVFLTIVLKLVWGHRHASLHVFHFLTRRNNVRFNCSFLQTSTGFQRQKKARKQQLYRFSQPCENQITQAVLKYLSFQCQIWAKGKYMYWKEQGRAGRDRYFICFSTEPCISEKAWHCPSVCTWRMYGIPSDLLVIQGSKLMFLPSFPLWAVSPWFASLFLPINLWEMRRERTPRLLVIKSSIPL